MKFKPVITKFKPQLLSNDEFDLESLDYTEMYISAKRDGVRAEVTSEGLKGRSLKVLPNVKLQEWFKEVYEKLPNGVILDAEIHSNTLPCRVIAGICNSKDKDIPEDMKLYIFGMFDSEYVFSERMESLRHLTTFIKSKRYELVKQKRIRSAKEAQSYYDTCIDLGFEGCVLMDGRKKYKCGRVTINQHIGFKLKPHKEEDLEIIGVTERFENLNESQTNELGRSFKRNTVDAKKETGIAAAFICKLSNGEECKVSLTGEEASRREIWKNQKEYIGRYAVVKSMDYGTKDKLRHPRLISIKEKVEK